MEYYRISSAEAVKELDSAENGLSVEEASKRLKKFGLNELESKKKFNPLKVFLSQFEGFVIWILILAAIVSVIVTQDYLDAGVIGLIVLLNAILGFTQEYRAEKAMEALKKLSALKATAIRDGTEIIIDSKHLVPGDIVLVKEGDKIPADCRIIESVNLRTNEASLTGESVEVEKFSEKIQKESSIGDRKNLLFMNTIATYGRAKAIVISTGMKTEFGKIAKMLGEIREEKTPLSKKMDELGKSLGIIVIGIVVVLFLIGTATSGISLIEMFLLSVSLAVAAVPEGLPAIVTITLAMGTKAMAKNKAIVRKISAVETLGATSVICSDKTGTLTKNEMTVREIFVNEKKIQVTGEGYEFEGKFLHNGTELDLEKEEAEMNFLLQNMVLCNNATLSESKESHIGDPTEIALLVLGKKAEYSKKKLLEKFKFIAELPFDSVRKKMTTVYSFGEKDIAFCKGSAESVESSCSFISVRGKKIKLEEKDRQKILNENNAMAQRGLRVLAFSMKEIPKGSKYSIESIENEMVFLGLVGMIDSPREEAKKAIELCKQAGIEVKMITGDHKLTAIAVAKELGLIENSGEEFALTGEELEKMSQRELMEKIDSIKVFARVNPEHKVKIVEALKAKGKIIAMTGDGVNDAPALKKAHIGIAMGITGTDVSKEASDIIIEDDNFATIVRAVEEGRKIYSNIKNFVKYLLAANIGEIMIISFAIFFDPILKWPIVLLPIQILWINLVTDGLPALALGTESAQENAMQKNPRNPKEHILHRMLGFILIAGIVSTISVLAAFCYGLQFSTEKAQTMAYATLIMFELFLVFNCRQEDKTFLEINPFTNKKLLIAIIISFILMVITIQIPQLNPIFKTIPLSFNDFAIVAVAGLAALIVPYIERISKKTAKRFFNLNK